MLNPFRHRGNYSVSSDRKNEPAQGGLKEAGVVGGKDNGVEGEIRVSKVQDNSDYFKGGREEMIGNYHGVKFYLSVLRPKKREKDEGRSDKDDLDIGVKDNLGVISESELDAGGKDELNASTKVSLNSISSQSQASIKGKKHTSNSTSRPDTIQEVIPEKINKTLNPIIHRSAEKSITELSRRLNHSKKHENKRVKILNPKSVRSSTQVQTQRLSKTPEKPLQDYKIFLKKAIQITSSKRRCLAQGNLYRSYQSIINYAP